MAEKSQRNDHMGSRKRQPRHGGDRDGRDGGDFRGKSDQLFAEDIENRIKIFMGSEDQELPFEPMNSYKRRQVHQISKPYNLKTESRGEEPERCVCLVKTSDSKVPQGVRTPRAVDFGAQTFPVNPGEEGVRLALKMDGSIEIWQENDQRGVLHECLVTARQIRVRSGKIVQPGEPGW